MKSLRASDFAAFYKAIHERPPFPWQIRLAKAVLAEGRWPDVLDLPTGVGKTSVLEIGLFVLAADPERAPRRSVFVVDRRVIVDQAANHALRVQKRLGEAEGGVLLAVADALRALWGAEAAAPPFEVSVLRGGMPRDDAWARRPDRPVVAVSTVDQVGSRLLFRGYGVGPGMASVHAGLLGVDSLFFLDEVHLSLPFAETLLAIRDRWRGPRTEAIPERFGVVRMSATPGSVRDEDRRFGLEREDREHRHLACRLDASKLAELQELALRGEEPARRERLGEACAARAAELVLGGARTVAVVVNRVDSARAAHTALAANPPVVGMKVVLVTGRMRALERAELLGPEVWDRVVAGRSRSKDDAPIVLVATQCIEAGADLDVDALVTECASLDALRQRFGRLDRLGELGESRAIIVARGDQVTGKDLPPDPVYGRSLAATWAWLRKRGAVIDFGSGALEAQLPDDLSELLSPQDHAPIVLPAYLDLWSQTLPPPIPDPEPGFWLHGPERPAADVQVVWRADLDEAALADAAASEPGCSELIELLEGCPPGTLESMQVPISAVRAWLSGAPPAGVADVEGAGQEPAGRETTRDRLALRWAADRSQVVGARELRPGDVLVVPAAYGGIRAGTWDPSATEAVRDYGDLAHFRGRGWALLRLDERVLRGWLPDEHLSAAVPRPADDEDPDRDSEGEVARWLAQVRELPLPAAWRALVNGLGTRPRLWRSPGTRWLVKACARAIGPSDAADITTEDDSASFLQREVSLATHSRDVQEWVRSFTRGLGLPPSLAADLALAGWLHDVGKADPRFQQLLVGGSEVRAAGLAEPLAKSAMPSQDAGARRIARERARYPKGYRHEILSVAMVQRSEEILKGATDRELVLHLVGSHHGWCRPFPPPTCDSNSRAVSLEHGGVQLAASTAETLSGLDAGVADRFWSLQRRYGWWGLAWLEAILRLADHRASEAEQGYSR